MRTILTRLFFVLALFALVLQGQEPARSVSSGTQVGNVAYSILSTDTLITTTTAFSAARIWTLPFAAATCIGQTCTPPASQLQIIDRAGVVTGTNTLTLTRSSGDTINGNAADYIISAPGFRTIAYPTSSSNWDVFTEGDYRVATLATGSKVSLTTNTAKSLTTLSISQGIWSCKAIISRVLNASTSVTVLSGSIGTTADTIEAQGTNTASYLQTAANVVGALGQDTNIGPVRLNVAATTTLQLVAKDTFTVSTDDAFGEIACIRLK